MRGGERKENGYEALVDDGNLRSFLVGKLHWPGDACADVAPAACFAHRSVGYRSGFDPDRGRNRCG
jgi:hypothetical protein